MKYRLRWIWGMLRPVVRACISVAMFMPSLSSSVYLHAVQNPADYPTRPKTRSVTVNGKANLTGLPRDTPVVLTFPCTSDRPQRIMIVGKGVGTIIRKVPTQPVSSRFAYVRDPGSSAVLGTFAYGPVALWKAIDDNSIVEVGTHKNELIHFIFQSVGGVTGLHIGGSSVALNPTFSFDAGDLTKAVGSCRKNGAVHDTKQVSPLETLQATQADVHRRDDRIQAPATASDPPQDDGNAAADANHPTWGDPTTGLMWARQDNGADVTWTQANTYCSNLRLGSYSNWRLPTIDELAGIYDRTRNVNGAHIKGGIKLSGSRWLWANRPGNASQEAGHFAFSEGVWYSHPSHTTYDGVRALCVRRAGE
jgi:hypothetical protein